MPKQELELFDYAGPLACALAFIFILTIMFFTCLNYCCVSSHDDLTVVEEWGYSHHIHHIKLGPHRTSVIARQMEPKYDKLDL